MHNRTPHNCSRWFGNAELDAIRDHPFSLAPGPEHAFAIVNAFIFAKVLLIGEQFRLGTRFRDRPLIYPILHKCVIFTVVLICFHVAESVLVGVWHGHTMVNSFPPMFAGSVRGVLSVGVICFVVLLPFFGFERSAELSALGSYGR